MQYILTFGKKRLEYVLIKVVVGTMEGIHLCLVYLSLIVVCSVYAFTRKRV